MLPIIVKCRSRLIVGLAVVILVSDAHAVDFLFFYDDPAGQGFLHPTQGAARQAALEEAGEIWGRLIPSTYEGETIEVRAKFGAYPAGSNTWASASPNYFYSDFDSSNSAYQEEVNYPKALANHMALRDLAPERHEIQMTVNQAQTFFFGIHGTPSPSEGDFISIAVHELGHGLGYDNSFQQDGDYGILGARTTTDPCPGCLPMPYDLFLTSGAGGPTLTSLSTSQRASALVSGNVFWNGATATAVNGGAAVKINAPNPYNAGSSIAHLDPSVASSVMVPGIAAGVVNRIPSFVDRALLRDMGWTINVATTQVHWTGLGADNDGSTAGNWSPALPEADDRLVFDQSPTTDVDMNLPLGTIQWISFPATAPAYTLRFKSNIDMDITSNGINNSSTNPQTIFLESPLEDEPTPSLFDSAATLTFKNTANAGSGNVDYYLSGGGTSIGGGPPPHIPHRFDRYAGASVTFENNSTAGTASFELEGGAGDGGPNAQVTFRHDSTASDAEFRTKGGRLGPSLPLGNVAVGFGGQVLFEDNSRAGDNSLPGHATFHNEGQAEYFNGAGGFTVFTDTSSAADAEIHNHGATFTTFSMNGIGGATFFYDNSNAGAANITNHADGLNHHHSISARTVFEEDSNAGAATIENLGSSSQSVRPGRTEFRTRASAANATIHNRGFIQVGDLAGRTDFYDDTTAANATIHLYEGYSDAGRVEFHGESTAASAQIFVNDVPEIVGSIGNGGHVVFRDDATAAVSDITLRAGACCNGVQFYNNATAADAQITTENGSGGVTFWGTSTAGDVTTTVRSSFSLGEGSVMSFYDQSNAADAVITLANRAILNFAGTSAGDAEILAAGGAVYTAGSQAYVSFVGSTATAADSTIIALGATAPLASPASIYITGGASPGNADLIAHGGTNGGAGGNIVFNGAANGSTARVATTAGGLVDFFDQRIYNDISLGSIEGAGTFALRGAHLTVGSRNTNTSVTGQIVDNPPGSSTGGRLTKVGTGTLTLAGVNTYSGLTTVVQGTLLVNGSLAGEAVVENGAKLGGTGTIGGKAIVNFGGKLSPGISPGTITLGGLEVKPGGILEMELGNPGDQIIITGNGNVALDGILNVSLVDGFVPTLGQTFTLLAGAIGSLTGAFDAINSPIINGLTFDPMQSASALTLEVIQATLVPGDYNGNGTVDAADYAVWRNNLGSPTSMFADDTPGVGPDDYTRWRAHFGQTAAGGAGSVSTTDAPAAVPEPATGILLIISVASIFAATRRRAASCGAIVLSIALAAPAAADYSVTDNVAFNAKKINPYTGGPAWELSDTKTLLNESFGPVTIGPLNADPLGLALETLFGVDLPHLVKLQTGASLSGQAKVEFGYYVTAGRLDISYPASANLNFATEAGTTNVVRANQTYEVDGGFAPGVSQRTVPAEFFGSNGGLGYATPPLRTQNVYQQPWFETSSPWASAWVEASANVQSSIFTKASAFGGLKEWRKDIRAGGNVGGRLVEIDPNGLYVAGEEVVGFDLTKPIGPIPIGGGAADLTIRVPNIAVSSVTNGNVQGPVIQAYKEQPLVTLTGNLERLIPFVGTILQNQIGPLGYDLLNLAGGPQLSLYQEMTFTPDPKVRLTFSEPVVVTGTPCGDAICAGAGQVHQTNLAEFDLDQAMNWKPMFSNSSTIQVRPTYLLKNTFRNETGLNVNLVIDVEALSLTGDFPPFNGTLGPVYDDTVTIPVFEGGELFAPQFNIPLGSVQGGSIPGIGPITTGEIEFQKSNLNIEPGLGDLALVTANFVGPDQNNPGYSIYDLDFTRSVDGGAPRLYHAQVSTQSDLWDPEGESYLLLTTSQDVVLTDPVTSQQYNVGRHFCAEPGGCDLSDLLPAPSPVYVDPNPSLGSLYVTKLPDDLTFVPNVDLNIAGHSKLDQYNAVDDFIQNSTVVESTELIDRAQYPSSTILVQTGEVIPDGIGRFHTAPSFANFVPLGMNDDGGVAFYSPLTDVPSSGIESGYYYVDESSKVKLARFGESAPGGGTIAFHSGLLASPNDLKQGALVAEISNSTSSTFGVFRAGPAGLTPIAIAGVSHGGTIQSFTTTPLVNEAGQVAFTATVVDGTLFPKLAIFVGNGSTLTEIVREGNSADGFTAPISSVDVTAINDSGKLALFAISENGQQGIYVGDAASRRPYAISGGPAPQGAQYLALNPPSSLNEAGHVAFTAFIQTSPGSIPKNGIYRGEFFNTVPIAQEGQLAPSGDGTLNQQISFGQMNDAGQVVFRAGIDAAVDYEAILMGNGGSLTQIARHGTIAANGGNPIPAFFGTPLLNNQGHVAFQDYLLPDNVRGIFLFDGTNLLQIVRPGQPLAGSSVRDAGLVDINEDMQVAYWAVLTDGRQVIARFEPSIYWSNPGSGIWGTPTSNWSLGIAPTSAYDVFIVAENPLTVLGLTTRTVKSLSIGGEGSASATLQIQSGFTITATNGTSIRPNGILTGTGTLAGAVTNTGTVSPGSNVGALQINGNFTQSSPGTLVMEIASPTSYDQLLVSGNLALGGTLAVSLLGGFIPALGQQFSIFGNQFDSITNTFNSLQFPTFNGLTFALAQSPGSVNLQVVESIGDFNHDGVVDAADYVTWRKGIGVATTQENYNLWRAHFGQTAGSGAGTAGSANAPSAALPEPASNMTLLLMLSGVSLWRRRTAPSSHWAKSGLC